MTTSENSPDSSGKERVTKVQLVVLLQNKEDSGEVLSILNRTMDKIFNHPQLGEKSAYTSVSTIDVEDDEDEAAAELDYDREGIPVTLNFDMTKPIGTAKVFEDKHGIRVEMKIHDPAAQAILRGDDLHHLSIDTAHFVRDKKLEEIDRNARAYGYEIGRGHPLVEKIESVSDDNPFMVHDWKERRLPWQS